MDAGYLIYGLIGIIAIFVVVKLLKWPIKILINGIVGVITLYIVNFIIANLSMVGINTHFYVPINIITALIAGFLGIPGVIAIILILLFL